MNKKEYLIKLLGQLEPVWNLAKWLKILLSAEHFDDNVLDVIIQAIEWAIHTAKDEIAKKKLENSLTALQKLKQMESESVAHDEKDLAELDKILENI